MKHFVLLIATFGSFTLNAAFLWSADSSTSPAGLVTAEFIYEEAPFPQCHASTIVETKLGLVAAWFGGEREQHPSVGIWLSRQEAGKWSPPVEVANGEQADGKRLPCWNPVLFQPHPGMLLLFYKVGPSPQRWWGELKRSSDDGRSWSTAEKLPDGILGPIKNKPLLLTSGDILSPTSTESPTSPSLWRVHFERSSDGGKTWTKQSLAEHSPEAKPIDAIQPSILRHDRDTLQALGRSRAGKVFETWSQDGGKTWSPVVLTSLPNPNSGTDAITLKDGRHVLVYNHTTRGRSPLNVALSTDGKTWQAGYVLETEPGEFSYPAVIQSGDERLHITYTWKRQKIKHVVLDPAKFDLKPLSIWEK